jgi:hypothetical protein
MSRCHAGWIILADMRFPKDVARPRVQLRKFKANILGYVGCGSNEKTHYLSLRDSRVLTLNGEEQEA